ncbi:MAG: exo-alpha-sialidase [Bryobacterales bacterium]|nr:exo-alpha-sialidase [Bryobacterales bacterium]
MKRLFLLITMGVLCHASMLAQNRQGAIRGSVAAVPPTVQGVRPLDPPALPGSGMPFLATAPDGGLFVSWIDPLPESESALRFARWAGPGWSQPETIATGRNWFVNWADFPAIAILPGGTMLAHWLTRPEEGGKYGYGIRIARRPPGAREWREIHGANLDDPKDYAGFLRFAPDGSGAVYLAPPKARDGGHRKTVRFVAFHPDGSVVADKEVDADACSCCPTALVRSDRGLVAAYRDHLPGEIRDISVVRFVDGAWTEPAVVHPDGWKIQGCPTDGPAMAAVGPHIGLVWTTRADERPRVQMALSRDGGATFTPPIRIDDGDPLGRPAITVLDKQNYLAVWLEKSAAGKADIRARRVSIEGEAGTSRTIAPAAAARSAGFPQVAVAGDQVVFAWRDERVRSAVVHSRAFEQRSGK